MMAASDGLFSFYDAENVFLNHARDQYSPTFDGECQVYFWELAKVFADTVEEIEKEVLLGSPLASARTAT